VRDGPGRHLNGLEFTAPPGRITGLVGIKDQGLEIIEDLLAGLLQPDSGSIRFGERPLGELQRHEWAYIPGKRFVRGIATSLSIADNLTSRRRRWLFPAGFRSASRLQRWQAESSFDIGRSWKQLITTLSGGMIQRLIFERELANPQPSLVICAEPWWGLDRHFQDVLLDRLRGLAASGCPVVVLSSDLDEAMAACDRLLVIRHGRAILEQAKPQFQRNRLAEAMVHGAEAIGS
jgi:simple sugar transport system ATP-binding protein